MVGLDNKSNFTNLMRLMTVHGLTPVSAITPVFDTLLVEELFGVLPLQHRQRGQNPGLGAGGRGDCHRQWRIGVGPTGSGIQDMTIAGTIVVNKLEDIATGRERTVFQLDYCSCVSRTMRVFDTGHPR